jgi:ribonuclease R
VARQRDRGFPIGDAIVAFIRAHPGKIGTADRAGVRPEERRSRRTETHPARTADAGAIEQRGRKIAEPAALPATLMADISGRDADGELIATPTEWDEVESGEPPKLRIHTPRRPQPGTAAGVGDRALLRIEKLDDAEGAVYRARVIKVIDHARTRVLGIFRSNPAGGGRLIPVDKKQAGRELNIAKADTGGAEDGDLVSVDLVRSRGFGLASGKVRERLGSLASEKAVSLIAIHSHEIPQAFAPSALREAEAAKPATLAGREDWRELPLVTIDPPDAGPRRRVPPNSISIPTTRAAMPSSSTADVAFYVRRARARSRRAGAAIQCIPGPRGAGAAGVSTTCARWCRASRAARWRCGW